MARASPDVLSQRLRELEEAGLVRRRKLGPPAGARVYELTAWGRELEPALVEFARWGTRGAFPRNAPSLGADALALALKTLFSPVEAVGFSARCELRLGEDCLAVVVDAGRLEVERGSIERRNAVIETDPGTLAELLWHGRRLTEAIRKGAVIVDGERRVVARLLELFPLPEALAAG